MTTACMHVYMQVGAVSLALDGGISTARSFSYVAYAVTARFSSSRSIAAGRAFFSPLKSPDPGAPRPERIHVGPRERSERPIGKCGPCARTLRSDQVLSTTAVNLGIFYLAADYNVE